MPTELGEFAGSLDENGYRAVIAGATTHMHTKSENSEGTTLEATQSDTVVKMSCQAKTNSDGTLTYTQEL